MLIACYDKFTLIEYYFRKYQFLILIISNCLTNTNVRDLRYSIDSIFALARAFSVSIADDSNTGRIAVIEMSTIQLLKFSRLINYLI